MRGKPNPLRPLNEEEQHAMESLRDGGPTTVRVNFPHKSAREIARHLGVPFSEMDIDRCLKETVLTVPVLMR